MDMLPTGVMQHTFDITIQAPGVATFSTPAQLTFPNVFDAAPGTQLNVLSFDHTTGRLEIDGTATVSADGLTATTDPGNGVTHPGWHGLTPPGGPSSPPCMPTTHTIDVTPVPVSFGLTDQFFTSDGGTFQFGIGNAAKPIDPNQNPCSPENAQANPLELTLTVDGPAGAFLMGLPEGISPYALEPGQNQQWSVSEIALLPNVANLSADQLYGVQIHIVAYPDGEPNNILLDKTFSVARFLAVSDPNVINNGDDNLALFLKTVQQHTTRNKSLQYFLPADVQTQFLDLGGNGTGLFDFGAPLSGIGTTTWSFATPTTLNVSGSCSSQTPWAFRSPATRCRVHSRRRLPPCPRPSLG